MNSGGLPPRRGRSGEEPGDLADGAGAVPGELRLGLGVDVVDRRPRGADVRRELQREAAGQLTPGRIADDALDEEARRAIGGDCGEAGEARQRVGLEDAVLEREGDARLPDAVEPALQHGRQAVPPGGVDQHQPFGGLQRGEVGRGMAFAGAVGMPGGGVQDRIEGLRVEVEHLEDVALAVQRRLELGEDRADEALAARMAEDDEDLDGGAPRPQGRLPTILKRPSAWVAGSKLLSLVATRSVKPASAISASAWSMEYQRKVGTWPCSSLRVTAPSSISS